MESLMEMLELSMGIFKELDIKNFYVVTCLIPPFSVACIGNIFHPSFDMPCKQLKDWQFSWLSVQINYYSIY